MTTLPSTTSIRLPRAAQPSGGPGLPAPNSLPPQGGSGLTGADVWRLIRGNILWIIAALALSIAIGLGIYFYIKATNPKYRSVALVVLNRPNHINPKDGRSDDDSNNSDFSLPIEQRTQTTMLMSESLWNDVIENSSKLRETAWFNKFVAKTKSGAEGMATAAQLAKADLSDNFRTAPIPDSKLVQISMDCAAPDDAKTIVQEIVGSHIDKQRQSTFDRTNEELTTALAWRDRYIKQEATAKSQMNDVNNSVGSGSTPSSMSRLNIAELTVSQLVSQQTQARMAATKAQANLDSLTEQLKGESDPYEVQALIRSDPTVQRLQAAVDQTKVSTETDAATAGANSTSVIRGRKELAIYEKQLEAAKTTVRTLARNDILNEAKGEVAKAKASADNLDTQIEQLRNELGDISSKIADYNSLKDEYEGYKELERQMNERIAVLQNALRQQVATVSWWASPTKPDSLSSPSLRVILPTSILAGVGLCIGILFLREVSDTSVRSPRDIVRVGPMPVLGMVSIESDDPRAAGVPMHTVISQAPSSMIAEQFRQIRTRLQHTTSLDTTRTLVVTSPGPGDGKTVVAANLAAGLALNGRRILLVDANFRRPELHKLFGVSNDVGFADVLDSVSKLDTSVQKTEIPNLELLPAGPKPANPTEMIESQLFSDFIDRALEEYDHVIFDAGPVLVVSEAVALAPRCDGVVTVVRARKNTRGMLTRVRDVLKQIRAEHVGVVLNGVQTVGGGYYARNIKAYYDYHDEV